MRLDWIPNAITLARLLSALPLAFLIVTGAHGWALALGLAAGISDAIDGLLAKRYHWQSRLGGLLDPAADKLLLVCTTAALAYTGELPVWFAMLVFGRDLVIVAGAITYNRLIETVSPAPSVWSKLTTFAQILMVLATLVQGEWPGILPQVLMQSWLWLTAAFTVWSGVHYMATWGAKARATWKARHHTGGRS